MFMLFKKKAVYTFTSNLWLRQKTFGRQNVFLCLWNSFPYARKKKKIKVSGLKQACVWGVGFVGNISESHVTHSHIQTFASSSLACLLSSQALGESRIACATINTCDICCYWKLLAMIKSLLHSFNHCLQWPRDCYPPFLTHSCLDFLQTVLAFDWFHVSDQRLDKTHLNISLLLL